jgi:hypothetical protein
MVSRSRVATIAKAIGPEGMVSFWPAGSVGPGDGDSGLPETAMTASSDSTRV